MYKGKRIQNQDIYERINFLTEAAKVAAENPDLVPIAQHLGTEADLTAKRSNIRTKPKRVLCKKCHVPLVFNTTARVSFGPEFTVYTVKNFSRYLF